MSTSLASGKRSLDEALRDARDFQSLFSPVSSRQWVFAGSLRRKRPFVGDVEHVVVPAPGEITIGDGLFTEKKRVGNLLFHELDRLVAAGTLAKHIYSNGSPRWGEKYRGVLFRGFNHEFFLAEPENFGSILIIRTGPTDFSHQLVIAFRRHGYWHDQGRLHKAGSGNEPPRIVPTPREEVCFQAADWNFCPPEERDHFRPATTWTYPDFKKTTRKQ